MPQVHWRQERDNFIANWTKLVIGTQENIPNLDMSYEDLNTGVLDSISSGGYPEVIVNNSKPKGKDRKKKQKETEPVEKEKKVEAEVEAEAEVEEVIPAKEEKEVQEVQETDYPKRKDGAPDMRFKENQDKFGKGGKVIAQMAEDKNEEAEKQEQNQEGEQVQENGIEEETKDGEVPSSEVHRGGKDRQRGRGGERTRGERGGRGNRDNKRGGNRGGFIKRNGEDEDGFTIVRDDNENPRGNRGRGGNWRGRGNRGDRGGNDNHRGGNVRRGGKRGGDEPNKPEENPQPAENAE